MKTIIENNLEIVNSIREIYRSDSIMVRKMIEKHFIPSKEEKKNNAEIPTSIILVEEMLDKVPVEYWSSTTNKTFEPCCGKGNFVLGVVDRMLKGLEHIEDKKDRCMIVMRNLYYADITNLNVFITTEILKCHLEKYCNGEVLEFSFNKYIGNTLELDIKTNWNIEGFELVVGNPPYQKNFNNENGRVGGSSLWSEFINHVFPVIVENGFLLFITPCSWMTGGSNKQSGNILNGIMKKNTVMYLNIEECNKYFTVGSTFSYYLVKKSIEDISFTCITKYKKKIYTSLITQSSFRGLKVIPKLFTNLTISIINKVENRNETKFNLQRLYDLDIRRKDRYIINKVENRNETKFNFQRLRDLDSSARKDRYIETGIYSIRHKVVDIRKSNYVQECMNKHKIVISMPGYIKTVYDFECGVSDASLFMYSENIEYSNYLIGLLDSKLYKFIINNYRELTGLNNHKNINRLSIIPLINTNIYDYFKLTDDEIKLIENNVVVDISEIITEKPIDIPKSLHDLKIT